VVAVVVDDRDVAAGERHLAEAAAAADRCPGSLRERRCWIAASSTPSSVATAIAASAFSTLCVPGRFTSTAAARPARAQHVEARLQPAALDVDGADVGTLADAVGDDRPPTAGRSCAQLASSAHSTARP
jgi:hypothetical protein